MNVCELFADISDMFANACNMFEKFCNVSKVLYLISFALAFLQGTLFIEFAVVLCMFVCVCAHPRVYVCVHVCAF